MKAIKTITRDIIIFIAIVISLIYACKFANNILNTYNMRYCQVSNIENDIITITNNIGKTWEYQTNKDIKVGTNCRIKMHTNYTDYDNTDDYIISIDFNS